VAKLQARTWLSRALSPSFSNVLARSAKCTGQSRLKCIAALPCNLLLMACFAGINVSQGSVATYARCGGIINIHLTANLLQNLPVKKILNRLRFDRIMVISLWPRFLDHPVQKVFYKSDLWMVCSREYTVSSYFSVHKFVIIQWPIVVCVYKCHTWQPGTVS